VFGATQRVRSSVMDQLGFLEEVLQGRVKEEEDKQPTPRLSGRCSIGDGAGGTGESDLAISGVQNGTPHPPVMAPGLPGQIESPRAVMPAPKMSEWPNGSADEGAEGHGRSSSTSKTESGDIAERLVLPLAGLSGAAGAGIDGSSGALSARTRRRESTLAWLRALLRRTQALSLLLRRHANQARISLDPTSTPRASMADAKNGKKNTLTFGSAEIVDAIPEDRDGE